MDDPGARTLRWGLSLARTLRWGLGLFFNCFFFGSFNRGSGDTYGR